MTVNEATGAMGMESTDLWCAQQKGLCVYVVAYIHIPVGVYMSAHVHCGLQAHECLCMWMPEVVGNLLNSSLPCLGNSFFH